MPRRKIQKLERKSPKKWIAFKTKGGSFYIGDVISVLKQLKHLRGKIQLIVTSPPFPLNKKKSYGNLNAKKIS
jgi:site-specific DNA-methyltransferase (cytosine-N4-specific)